MNNPILDKTFQFSLEIITFCEILEGNKKFVVSNQLLKSGTSIGANVVEAQNAESKADFIHKMKIAAKEANETNYWLRICKFAPSYPESNILLENINEIGKILTKIIATSKSK
jgi:four helix bundle protein